MAFKNRKVSVISQSVTFQTNTYQTNVVGTVIPPGTVQAFMGTVAPSGWAFCHGQSVSRSTFSALFSAIGSVGGNGDGVTTFNIPDLRGVFLRGMDHGRGLDGQWWYDSDDPYFEPGRNGLGTYQADENKSHSHQLGKGGSGMNNGTYPHPGTSYIGNVYGNYNTWTTGTYEARPKNVAVNYIIKT